MIIHTGGQKLQSIQIDSVPWQDAGQKFIEGNVLELGNVDATSMTKQPLAVPVGIHSTEPLDQAVMLTKEHGVQGGQAWLFRSTAITWRQKEY